MIFFFAYRSADRNFNQCRARRLHSEPLWASLHGWLCCLLSALLIVQPALLPTAQASAKTAVPTQADSAPANPTVSLVSTPQSNVDLTVSALDTANVVTDSQTLIISGTLGATIRNAGSAGTSAQFRVIAFEDRNANGAFNAGVDALLGSTNVTDSVAAGASLNLSLALSGTVTFKGNLIYVLVDSENAIAETNEANNLLSTAGVTVATVLIPYAAAGYRYKVVGWGEGLGFEQPNFDDASFVTGNAGFGVGCGDLPSGTAWPVNTDILVRKKFTLAPSTRNLKVRVAIDNDVTVFINGNIIKEERLSGGCARPDMFLFNVPDAVLVNGENVIAMRGHDYGITTYLDAEVRAESLPPADLTSSLIRKNDAAFPTSSELIARIGNGGGTVVPPGVKVSFYRGDPLASGTLIGTTQTATSLQPGQYEDVKVTWNNPPTGLHPITVVADDNGAGQGTVTEANETNNKAMANIALGLGPFTLVDDLLARFKDGAVDLKWSPIAGATGYNIYRRTGNGAPQLIKQNHPRANFADAGLTNGTTYYYTVRWVNANNIESGDGTEISATPTAQGNRNDVPPTILSAPVTRAVANAAYAYDANARDPNASDTLSYQLATPMLEAANRPTINSSNGLIQWTPTFARAGYHDVTVRVTDSRGRFATQTYRLFVEIPNSPPLVNAGPDQTIMATETANLLGTVLDDGLPFGGTLTTSWGKLSGPGTVTFANPGQPVTTATFGAQGTYVLRLTASDSALASSDEVTINVVRPFASRLYTLNADFDQGNLNNVDHRIPHQLQLGEQAQPFNFIWVAVSSKGTIVKINTDTGQVLGEYWTSPDGQPKNPSRTTVDLNGNVWVANRDGNSVTRIGLVENGQCFDRNGNGNIDTSTGLNDIKAWTNAGGADTNGGVTTAQDECVINYVRVGANGTRHISVNKNNDVWVSGWGAANQGVFNLIDGVTGLIKRTEGSVGFGGYGGLIDKNGVIWSARPLLRWDTAKSLNGPNGVNWRGYSYSNDHDSYGLAIDSQGNVWNTSHTEGIIRKYAPDGTLLGAFPHGYHRAQGCAVDQNGHVWVAHALNNSLGEPTVGHLKNDGTYIGKVSVGQGPTGVAVDVKGKIWVTNLDSRTVSRIDPNAGPVGNDGITRVGAVDFTSPDLGGNPYNYSDMTGSTLTGAPNTGTWTVIFDSQIANAEWGRINWNARVCGDGALTVTAASSTDNTTFSTAQNVTRGQDLTVANGRYLKISVLFKRASTGESPILYDLSVGTEGYAPPAQTNAPPLVHAGADQETALFIPIKLKGSVCDDGLPNGSTLSFVWSKVSGPGNVTFANANALATTATINTPGAYVLRLTASDSTATVSDEITINIAGANSPPVIASTPPTAGCSTRPYIYQLSANDPNFGDVLTYALPTAPAGMTINSATGLIQWTPAAAQLGNHNVKATVTDLGNNTVEQTWTINVASGANTAAPTITSTAPTATAVDLTYTYQVTATDPDSCEVLSYSLDVAPAGMTINPTSGLVQWTPTAAQAGNHNVTVRVRDFGGLFATQSFTINVAASLQPPTVALSSPTPGSTITQLVNLIGSVGDPNGAAGPPVTWKVELRREGSSDYKLLGSGTGAVTNGTLAQFDPTMLANDVYYVRLSAVKGFEYRDIEAPYNVSGELKLGNFTISFTDLTIPVAGLPIVITREYNSLDTRTGEFGAGWRLGLAGRVTDSASEAPFEGFRPGTRVYVTRPDGRRVGFTFAPVPSGFIGVFPRFTPDPGVYDTLEVNPALLVLSGNTFYEFPGGPYNPQLYFFKTKENVTYAIDEVEGLKRITDINGNTLTVTPTGIVSSTGVAVAFERNAQNRITKITEPNDGTGAPGALRYVYDSRGNLVKFFDQMNAETEYFYEHAPFPNYLTRIEDPLNRPQIRSVFNNDGRLIGLCDANGNPATLAGCTRFNPNAASRLETIINARGFRTDLLLDERGNVLTERRWLDGTNFLDTVRTYDAANNLLTERDPAGNTKSFTYDARGNQLTATDAGNRTTTYTYNAACNKVATVTDPASNVTRYGYDDRCNLRFVTDALNNTTEYRYNAAGQRTEMIPPLGGSWVWAYDSNGFLQSLTDPFGKATRFTFNASGELLTRIDRNNRRIDFEYDDTHRIKREIWNTTPQRVTTYNYNTLGQLTSAVDPDSALTIDYFNTGLVRSVDNNGTPGAPRVIISYNYDTNGNVTQVQDSLGGSTDYSYDALDRLSRVTQSGTGVNEKRVDMVYDNASFLREMRRFSNLAGTQGVANTFFDYDCGGCAGRVKSIHHRKASNNAVIHDMDFTRDALGNILTATDAEGTHTYTYDTLRRLRTAMHSQTGVQPNENYTYDVAGNRLTSHLSSGYTYSYQGSSRGNRLLQDNQFRYEYDGEGNLSKKIKISSSEYDEYAYDSRNRMVSITIKNASGIEQRRSEYVYDSANRRIKANEAGQTAHFAYDNFNPLLKLSQAGQILSRRLYSTDIDAVIADEVSNSTRWMLTDQVGTVRDLLSNDGSAINHYAYDSFGRLMQQANLSLSNDILFTAREFNTGSTLGYYRTRFYDPNIGRFQQEDLADPYQYEYVLNNPTLFSDPTGLIISQTAQVVRLVGIAAFRAAKLAFKIYSFIGTVVALLQVAEFIGSKTNAGNPAIFLPRECIGAGDPTRAISENFLGLARCIYRNDPLWFLSWLGLLGAAQESR